MYNLLINRRGRAINGAAMFGKGNGAIYLETVACSGKELALDDCSNLNWADAGGPCVHTQDAGVVCQANGKPVLQTVKYMIMLDYCSEVWGCERCKIKCDK